MELISYDGVTFSTLGVDAGVPDGQSSASRRPVMLDRANQTPIYAGMTQDARPFVVQFSTTSSAQSTMQTLLGLLDFTNPNPRTMIADMNDGTRVSCPMVTRDYRYIDVNVIEVVFVATRALWKAVNPTVLSIAGIDSEWSIPLVNAGGATTWPLIKVGWSAQRTFFDPGIGWTYKREVTITNGSDEDWIDEPVCIDLGDTAAMVTGAKMQADGDDIMVVYRGHTHPRTLTNMNTKRTLLHTLVSIKSGSSKTLEIWYGNSAATAPDNLHTRTGTDKTYVAYDTEGFSGTASGGSTSTLVDAGSGWETDRWAGCYLLLLSGTGSVRYRQIVSNTSDTLTLNRLLATAPDATTVYAIVSSGMMFDGGRVSSRTASSITDSGRTRAWGTNQLIGATVTFVGGSGATPATMTVASNTGDTLTFTSNFSVQPAVNDSYNIEHYGVWRYLVDTALNDTRHRGVRRINRYYEQPGVVWPVEETPAGWGIDTYLDNQDDYAVYAPYNVGSGGGHAANWWPLPRIRRRVGQEAGYKDEGNGDGMSVRSPQRFQGIYFDYQMQAESGLCDVILACREPKATDWTVAMTDSTTRASLTDVADQHVDLSSYNLPSRVGFFLVPADEAQEIVSSSATTDDAEFRTLDVLELYIDNTTHTSLVSSAYTVGAETAIYDLQAYLRFGGGTTPETPYEKVSYGGDGNFLGLESGEKVWLRTDPDNKLPIVGVYNSSDVRQYRAAWAAEADHYEDDQDGTAQATVQGSVFALRPFVNLLGTSQNRITGWTLTNSAGVSSTLANAASPDWDGEGKSIRINVTATPVGAWSIDLDAALIALTPGELYEFGAAFYRSGMAGTIEAALTAGWQTGGGSAVVDSATVKTRVLASNTTWYPVGGGARIAEREGTAVTETDGVIMNISISGSGSMTGDIYIDSVTLGAAHLLHIGEDDQGTLTAEITYTTGYQL